MQNRLGIHLFLLGVEVGAEVSFKFPSH
jgi:hypothetical protein